MGRQRKFQNPRRLFSVGRTAQEADAKLDVLQDMVDNNKSAGPGRKSRVDHYETAFSVATALQPEPQSRRQPHKRRPPQLSDRIGAKPVRTTGGTQLAGFDLADDDPKNAKKDMRAAQTLQHALAWRGEYITVSNALKIMQRARVLLAKNKIP